MRRPTKKELVIALCLVSALILGLIALSFLSSAKFALVKTGIDLKRDGIEGLRAHLSGEALSTFDAIDTLTRDEKVSAFLALFSPTDSLRILKTYLPDLKWEVLGMSESENDATVTLAFVYKDIFYGELEAIMTKTSGVWYIDSFRIDNMAKY